MVAESSLVQSAAWRLASTVALTLVSLVTVPVFTRLLGLEQWGLLVLFQAAIAPLALLDLGIGTATVKYVAEAIGRGDREEATKLVQTTLVFNLVIGASGALAIALCAEWLASAVFAIPPAQQHLATAGFRLMGLSWFGGIVGATCTGVLTAHRYFGLASRLRTVAGLASGLVGILTVVGGGGLFQVVIAQTVVSLSMAGVWFASASNLLPGIRALPRWYGAAFRKCFAFGFWQALASAGGFLTSWSDRYVLGMNFPPALVGVYSIALSITSAAYGAFHDMGEVLFPAVSQKQGEGNLAGARRLSIQAGWALSIVAAVASAVIATVGGDFITLWITPEAAALGTPTLRLLSVAGILGMAITGPYFFCLGIGRSRLLAGSSLLTGFVVCGLGVVLAPILGLSGVALALVGGGLAQWLVVLLIQRRVYRPDIQLAEFALHIWAPAVSGVAVLALLVTAHDAFRPASTWARLVLETIAFVLLAAALQFGVNELLPGGRHRRRLVSSLLAPLGIRLEASRPPAAPPE